MDPPWQLATSNPTRGVGLAASPCSHVLPARVSGALRLFAVDTCQVAIGYQQLGDSFVKDLPVGELQDSGLLFVWVINAKYRFALQLLKDWGYTYVSAVPWSSMCLSPPLYGTRFVGPCTGKDCARRPTFAARFNFAAVPRPCYSSPRTATPSHCAPARLIDEVVWIKQTVNRRLAKSHGYYLQHAKETCLVGLKVRGSRVPCFRHSRDSSFTPGFFALDSPRAPCQPTRYRWPVVTSSSRSVGGSPRSPRKCMCRCAFLFFGALLKVYPPTPRLRWLHSCFRSTVGIGKRGTFPHSCTLLLCRQVRDDRAARAGWLLP